jgi:hypothetical protein
MNGKFRKNQNIYRKILCSENKDVMLLPTEKYNGARYSDNKYLKYMYKTKVSSVNKIIDTLSLSLTKPSENYFNKQLMYQKSISFKAIVDQCNEELLKRFSKNQKKSIKEKIKFNKFIFSEIELNVKSLENNGDEINIDELFQIIGVEGQ